MRLSEIGSYGRSGYGSCGMIGCQPVRGTRCNSFGLGRPRRLVKKEFLLLPFTPVHARLTILIMHISSDGLTITFGNKQGTARELGFQFGD
jgi:hypothetical protein